MAEPSDPDEAAVLAANQAFYDAFERCDPAAMRAVWDDAADVVCTHPGWPLLRGIEDVADSWARLLANGQRLQFILTDVAVVVCGDAAWVTLDENLLAGDGSSGTVAAVNVFRRAGSGSPWRLVVHQGTSVLRTLG